jgi:hypothetical protein
MIIKCKNWKPSDEFFRGKCSAGKFKGRPTFGHCIDLCDQISNDRTEMEAYIKTLAKNKLTPEQIEEQERKRKEKEEHEQKLLNELPKGLKLIGNLARHLKEIHAYYKATGKLYVSDEEAARRLAICEKCPDDKMVRDKKGVMRCTLESCGCYLDNPNERKILDGKTKYIILHCGNGDW